MILFDSWKKHFLYIYFTSTSVVFTEMVAFGTSGVGLEPLLQVFDVSSMTAARTPRENSFDDEMTHDTLRRVGGLAMLAEPALLKRSPALAASRLNNRGLLVQLADRRYPTQVDDLRRFVPHLMPVQQVNVRLQPVLLNEFVDRQVFPTLTEANKDRRWCLNVTNF